MEIILFIVCLVVFYSCVAFGIIAINSLVTPQEFYEYKQKVRDLRQQGYTDKEICKKLKISKSFLREVESEVT